jgi:hypothetical protein
MRYKSAFALEMAVKAAAAASPMDTGLAVSAFYFHRLLCRVFAGDSDSFVLKGGRAMLARNVDARATRDIDLLSTERDLDEALGELVRLAETDLDDFMTFEFAGSHPTKAEDEYRNGLSVRFIPVIGAKRLPPFSVDLVVDEVPLEGIERIAPADRIEVDGLETCDYLVYPVEAALADKLCALVEMHGGRASSRVKDLVDIAVYATASEVDGARLQARLRREATARRISLGDSFGLPESWGASQARQFAKLCQRTGLPKALRTIGAAAELARKLLDPAIRWEADGKRWNPKAREWERVSTPSDKR